MKIIFLDIDGVIATTQCWGKGKDNKWASYKFDEKCVATLNFILQETGAEIVMSSDWKKHYTLQEMREIFCHNNVLKGPMCFTPNSQYYADGHLEGGRSFEIKEWLKLHSKNSGVAAKKADFKWVAVDDLKLADNEQDDFFEEGVNFVECPKQMEGIKQTGIKEKIIKILNKEL